jgi:ATP phosphoribosyltransferase regulatory subunit
MSDTLKLKIPQGMRDWLPGEASRKREMINELLQCISLWGYEEINTPMLEYYQALLSEENGGETDQIYKLVDRDGRILALRPEMTIPIARVVSSKLPPTYPWRLMYGGEVFRYEEIQTGRQREFCQVGVELLGSAGAEADSEILALTVEALRSVGLENFTISLGHTGILKGLLESLAWEEVELKQVRTLILEKDFVGLSSYLLSRGMKEKQIKDVVGFLTCQLAPDDLAKEWQDLPEGILVALADLRKIIRFLKIYGYDDYVQIDLSTLRNQEYYTGMVFEIYTAGIGYPIGGGGRYDQLLNNWGRACPATGFALGVERILLSLPRKEKPQEENLVLLVGTTAQQVIPQALELRKKGNKVMTKIGEMSREDAERLALSKGAVLFCSEEENQGEEGNNR